MAILIQKIEGAWHELIRKTYTKIEKPYVPKRSWSTDRESSRYDPYADDDIGFNFGALVNSYDFEEEPYTPPPVVEIRENGWFHKDGREANYNDKIKKNSEKNIFYKFFRGDQIDLKLLTGAGSSFIVGSTRINTSGGRNEDLLCLVRNEALKQCQERGSKYVLLSDTHLLNSSPRHSSDIPWKSHTYIAHFYE